MQRPAILVLALFAIAVVVGAYSLATGFRPFALNVPGGAFSFATAGDFGWNANTDSVITRAQSDVDFFVALGDLKYADLATETDFCNNVKARFTKPFQIIPGNHEQDGQPDGLINNYAACLPDRMNSTGTYGVEYYYDVNQLARFIMVSASLPINGYTYTYASGSPELTWLNARIDEAKALGYWTIVGVHNECMNMAFTACKVGESFYSSVLAKRPDLLLHGDVHSYQRGKQITCHTSTTCIVDDGADNSYARGAGTVVMIIGSGGRGLQAIAIDPAVVPGINYFTKGYGSNACYPASPCISLTTQGNAYMKFDVSSSGITATLKNNGGASYDTYTIGGAAPPPTLTVDFAWSPPSPVTGQTVTFSASSDPATTSGTWDWNFGDGTTGTTANPSHVYTAAGTYSVTVTLQQTAPLAATATKTKTITVAAPSPALSASFTWSPQSPTVGQTASFTGTASGGSAPYSFAWNFGDSSTASGASVTHSYAVSGSYTVTMTVSDATSAVKTSTNTVTVTSPSPRQLTASYTWTPSPVLAAQVVTFTATVAGGVPPYTGTWDFGDGAFGTGLNTTHAYTAAGNYQAKLTIQDSTAAQAQSVNTITVLGSSLAPSPQFPFPFTIPSALPIIAIAVTGTATVSAIFLRRRG